MKKLQTSTRSPVEQLRRLSVVFADELRLRIVTELFIREMSPSQFSSELGGGSVPHLNRHFKRLEGTDWLRLIRTESGGRRRGATEHFYRAPELAVFDERTWPLVPYSVRVAFSWRTFKQLAERVREALLEGTFDARPESRIESVPLVLDQLGWERVITAVDRVFEELFEEQADARMRTFHSDEEPLLATVALALFESPPASQGTNGPSRSGLVEGGDVSRPLNKRISTVLSDELFLRIVAAANLGETSAKQFHAEFGGAPIDGVRRRFKRLENSGWLKRVRRMTGGPRRGAVENFYRATGPTIRDGESWAEVPGPIAATQSWQAFGQLAERIKQAIQAGTFEARTDNHFSWLLLRLDRQGWTKAAAALQDLSAFIAKEHKSAQPRLARSGETPIPTTAALAAFESPSDSAKAP